MRSRRSSPAASRALPGRIARARYSYTGERSAKRREKLSEGRGAEGDVDEPGPGHLDIGDICLTGELGLKGLRKVFPFEERSILDLGAAARRAGLGQTGLRNLAAIFLGFRLPKGTKTTNWAARRLSAQQIDYAATDAWACRELYLRFRELGML